MRDHYVDVIGSIERLPVYLYLSIKSPPHIRALRQRQICRALGGECTKCLSASGARSAGGHQQSITCSCACAAERAPLCTVRARRPCRNVTPLITLCCARERMCSKEFNLEFVWRCARHRCRPLKICAHMRGLRTLRYHIPHIFVSLGQRTHASVHTPAHCTHVFGRRSD